MFSCKVWPPESQSQREAVGIGTVNNILFFIQAMEGHRRKSLDSRACLRTLTLDTAYACSNLHRLSLVNLGHYDRHEPWMPALLKGLDAVDIILPPVDLGGGTTQWDPLSTCLFSVALSAILSEEIARRHTGEAMLCLSYVDDTAIMGSAIQIVEKALQALPDMLQAHGLHLQPLKSSSALTL